MAARFVRFPKTNISQFSKFSAIRGIQTTGRPLLASNEFNSAKDRVNTLKEDPGNEAKLKLYALFKQVSFSSSLFGKSVNLNMNQQMTCVY